MANLKQYQDVQIGGYVPQRILGQRDLSPLQNYVQARNQMWEDTIKQKSAIDVALGNLKLNAAEDKWKYDYGRRIQKKIDEAAQFGDYSRALDTAILEAGKAVSSPEVMGRIRANEAYEKKKQEVESLANAGTIGGITKERWLAQNKYSYTDTYDNEGNIVGGSEWKAGWEPVKKVDMSRLVTLAGQLASPVKRASSSSSTVKESDEQGIGSQVSQTGDLANGQMRSVKTGFERSSGSSYQRETLTKEKIDEVYNQLFALDPDNMNALMQDYDDYEWKAKQLKAEADITTDPEKKNRLQSSYKAFFNETHDVNGNPLKVKEYMLNKIGLITKNMAYDNITTSTQSGRSNERGLTFGTKYALQNKGDTDGMADLVGTGSTGGTQTSNPANVSWVDMQTDKMRKAGIFTN
ncbi:MAG: hypothetical protein PUJ60_02200 [bacterium]|nr:hypothetical protein [bacterium]MDY4108963.1 hypothetical protein [Bacilli bacterium]